MVFSGRPSEACYPCRKGRLRCDRLQPGCTQCSRKQTTCPGYRDLSDFYFRDETANAAFKVQNRKPRKRYPPKTKQQGQPLPGANVQKQQQASAVATAPATATAAHVVRNWVDSDAPLRSSPAYPHPEVAVVRYRNISQPLEDLACTYFMTDYIATSPFEYLPKLCPYGLRSEDAMSASVLAASFASLSLKLSDTKLMKQATAHYANALYQTNQALSSAKLAVEDGTLAAVLLLGLFEAIVFSGQQSLDSWNAHTLGAVELLRLRGTRQLETPLGRKLFIHSSNNIRTSCAHSMTPVPVRFLKLYEEARPHLDLDDPFLSMTPVVDRVAALRSRISQTSDSGRRDLVIEALDLDAATAKIGHDVPEGWRFTTRPPGERSPMPYKGMSFGYPSLRALRYWNALRIIRLFLNDLIWVQSSFILNQGPDQDDKIDYAGLQRSASRKTSTLVVEVLASCGEYLEPSGDRFSVTARCLIWPLSVISEVSLTPPDARQFALDCLDRLSRDGRIPQLVSPTNGITRSQGAEWLHLYHLA